MEFDKPISIKESYGQSFLYCPACHSGNFCDIDRLKCLACGENTLADISETYCEECKVETRRSVMAAVAKLSERTGLSLNSSFSAFRDIASDEPCNRWDIAELFFEAVYNINWQRGCGLMTAVDMVINYVDEDKRMRTRK